MISYFELVNPLIASILFFAMVRKSNSIYILISLFLYLSVHYGYAISDWTSSSFMELANLRHKRSYFGIAMISEIIFIGIVFFYLGKIAVKGFLKGSPHIRFFTSYIACLITITLCGYFLNFRYGDIVQFKNVVSFELMILLILIGVLSINRNINILEKKYTFWYLISFVLFILFIDLIGIYEVWNNFSWSFTPQISGDIAYRASSLLFNPNILAFWASLIYLTGGFIFCCNKNFRVLMILVMFLASIAIYISGSRSLGYLLIIVSFIPLLLIRSRFSWVVLVIYPITSIFTYILIKLFAYLLPPPSLALNNFILLGERFFLAPINLFSFISNTNTDSVSVNIPPEIIVSITGRYQGPEADSGWMNLYRDFGSLGVGSIFFTVCVLFIWGLRTYLLKRNFASVYAICILSYVSVVGIVMKFQIIPTSMFIGIFLIACISYWQFQIIRKRENNANFNS